MKKKKAPKKLTLKLEWQKIQVPKATPTHQSIAKRHANEAIKHFKTDGWALNYSCLLSDLANDLLGYPVENIFLNHFLKKGYDMTLENGKILLEKKK